MISAEGSWLRVRWYEESELPRLAEIHAECFPREHWTVEDILRFASKAGSKNLVKVLANEDGKIFGTLLYTLTEEECRIRRVAIDEQHRRNGFGTYLVNSLTGVKSQIQRRVFTARVRADNLPGLLFFRDNNLGFTFDAKAPRHRYKDGMEGYVFRFQKQSKKLTSHLLTSRLVKK